MKRRSARGRQSNFALQSILPKKGGQAGARPGRGSSPACRSWRRRRRRAPPGRAPRGSRGSAGGRRRDPAQRLRPVALEALGHLDQPGLLQHLQVAAEVAVGEAAEPLQVGEHQALGVGGQRGQHAEPRPLVDHPVEALVGEAAGLSSSMRLRRSAAPRPPASGRARTAAPIDQGESACGPCAQARQARPAATYQAPTTDHRPRQEAARGENPQPEGDLPEAGRIQRLCGANRSAPPVSSAAGDRRRQELHHGGARSSRRPGASAGAAMRSTISNPITPAETAATRDPERQEGGRSAAGDRQPARLAERRRAPPARRSRRRRSVPARGTARPRQLAADRADLGQGPIQVRASPSPQIPVSRDVPVLCTAKYHARAMASGATAAFNRPAKVLGTRP